MGVAASIAARSPCEISTRAARRRMMYNSQIQRLHSFHRPPAQAVEACGRLSESGASQCPAYLQPLKGPRMMSCPHMFWFLDAGMTNPSTRCGGRRPKSAKARSRGKLGTGWQRALWRINVGADLDDGRDASTTPPGCLHGREVGRAQ